MVNDPSIHDLERTLETTSHFAGLSPQALHSVASCARPVRFEAGQFLFREGQPADEFYIILQGRVAIELRSSGRGQVVIQTLEEDDLVGFSWVHPPPRWIFDAQALTFLQAISIHAEDFLEACHKDPEMGFEVMRRLIGGVVDQLQATRLQVLEFYGVRG